MAQLHLPRLGRIGPPPPQRWTERLGVAVATRGGQWSCGFGPSVEPYQANDAGRSFPACRRRLLRSLHMHRRHLAASVAARAAFAAAEGSLRAVAEGERWCQRVCVDQFDLTFWLLPLTEADRRGADLKRPTRRRG